MTAPECSFCCKREAEVWRMIAGPRNVFACNECIDLMHEMIHAQQSPPPDPKVVPIGRWLKADRVKK